MKASIILLAAAGLAAAQNIPSCVTTCLAQSLSGTDCQGIDITCICKNINTIMANGADCFAKNCSADELKSAQSLLTTLCPNASVSGSMSASGSASASASSSSASASASTSASGSATTTGSASGSTDSASASSTATDSAASTTGSAASASSSESSASSSASRSASSASSSAASASASATGTGDAGRPVVGAGLAMFAAFLAL
ncbi:unnamed protein product [Clonostachys rhizophaga]|uniref:CFEM domain-containing protein n=1 Tax=Clonostachys rhizophaga TaxID=160324 RepID=A0A9N9YF61_9HYPO|nr:unnamed protein product [Clonostachys rhizophaga]